MRLLLYNIRYGVGNGSSSAVPLPGARYLFAEASELERIISFIRSQDPDIVGLIEVDTGSLRSNRVNQAEVIAAANDTEFGLASYFFSRDIARVWRVSEALEYGMVGVNTGHVSTAEAPFGGVKSSGLGREGGRQGLDDFMEVKYICMGGIEAAE